MQYRLIIRNLDSERSGQIVPLDLRLGIFQRRGHSVNIRPHGKPRMIPRELAVALRKKIL
jgi:hypothetical protein